MKLSKIFFLLALAWTGCSTSSPSPEGKGEHKQGYDLGRSDAVKQQYWIVQNLQKQPKTRSQVGELPILIPGETVNGVTTVPHRETLRIEQ